MQTFFQYLSASIGLTLFAVGAFWILSQDLPTHAQTVTQIRNQISDKQSEINALKEKMSLYEKNITLKQDQAKTLKDQLAILEDQMEQTKQYLVILSKEKESVELDVQALGKEIQEVQTQIDAFKVQLAEMIRTLYQEDQQESLEILITNESFSEFFEQVNRLQNVQSDITQILQQVIAKKNTLVDKKAQLEVRQSDLRKIQAQTQGEQEKLTRQQDTKKQVLTDTKSSEKKFQDLLYQLRREQAGIESEIANLEHEARKKLQGAEKGTQESLVFKDLAWPVPSRVINAYFHDPAYPYRNVFEHPAIDIKAGQGEPIFAAADGYVARAKDAGMGYSYIMLLHGAELATVYGHVSAISVEEGEFVKQGQKIGNSGGKPGTRGAGNLTTGPHLHFEVRKAGIPVNPLSYLP